MNWIKFCFFGLLAFQDVNFPQLISSTFALPSFVDHIGAIGKRLEKIELPSGKKVTEAFDEVFRDKPELLNKVIKIYDDAWPEIIDETRRATRYQKCAHSLADLKDIMGSTLTDVIFPP